MYRTLAITSPPMRGEDVTYAQKMLNEFGAWVGAVDGVFGEFTGRACSEAKYKLGYAKANITPTYGTELDAFLRGGEEADCRYEDSRQAARKEATTTRDSHSDCPRIHRHEGVTCRIEPGSLLRLVRNHRSMVRDVRDVLFREGWQQGVCSW